MGSKNKEYLVFKNKEMLRENYSACQPGKLVKIFIPSSLRTIYWDESVSFVYGLVLSKEFEEYFEYYTFFNVTALVEASVYIFTWCEFTHRPIAPGQKAKSTLIDISKVTAQKRPALP